MYTWVTKVIFSYVSLKKKKISNLLTVQMSHFPSTSTIIL